ncbi:MAG TPA: hypothetical protein P5567_01400 [Kiritimatiellia bacterium]|nr:hypothetical protein [Kiritimatiellia bacterium]HRZ11091.1 hypothetical protein [Kiritimatiellia bacterium]HSA19737.1 hypothetical protein [Kiritimatiellia bacterium]
MTVGRRALVWMAVLAALLAPVGQGSEDRLMAGLRDALHFPLFALLTWSWGGRFLPCWRTAAVMTLAVLGVEAVQPLVGREAEWRDALFGLAGVVMAMALQGMRQPRHATFWKALMIVAPAIVLCPLLIVGADRWEARRAFPLLAAFRSPWEIGRWTGRGCDLRRVRRDGAWAMRVAVRNTAPAYPGAFLMEAPRDWSGMAALQVAVCWPGPDERELWARADDRPGSPPYSDRLQKALAMRPGTNRWVISFEEWKSTPGGRPFDFRRVRSLGLFFAEAAPGEALDILEIRLVPASRPPAGAAQ